MTRILLAVFVLSVAGLCAQEADNLILNGSFAGDENGDGIADGWSLSAGAPEDQLAVECSLEDLGDGRFAQKLDCTVYEGGHAMVCQVGTLDIKAGQWYEARLRAKGENLRYAHVGLHDTDGWKNLGLWNQLNLGRKWREFSFKFKADHSAHETTRFQIWFTRVGTLWVSDISLTTTTPELPDNIIPDTGTKNLLPNSGFETLAGWGMPNWWTYGWEVAPGLGPDGSSCAAVEWKCDDPEYGYYFDYFEMVERPLVEPYLQAIGRPQLEPGETYTLSAYMRCDDDHTDAPAMIGFRGPGARRTQDVKLTSQWQRVSVTEKATGSYAIVQLGPTFAVEDAPQFAGCTVYIDNVQLERGGEATDFEAHPLDLFVPIHTEHLAGLEGREVSFTPAVVSAFDGECALDCQVTDFNDEIVARKQVTVQIGKGATKPPVSLALPGPGFYRVTVTAKAGEHEATNSARWALYPPLIKGEDTAFGMNHAFAYNGFLRRAKQIGLSWVRDWSLKWEHVETQKGAFTFDKTDFQIRRPQKEGMNVLCMFPFPSAEWSSVAPPDLHKTAYPANRIRQAFAPKDPADLTRYVTECVKRYKGEVDVWEVFNESVFTSYSLPKAQGYKAEDYVPLLKAVYEGCKAADPECLVMGGYSAPPQRVELYGPMFREGGLDYCDLVSIHLYPGGPPESLDADLKRLNEMMDENGGRKPTWMTEYAYYADDDTDFATRRWPTLMRSEWHQACWNTRACAIMFGNGVEKIFYHIWPTRMNEDIGSRIFFEYAGAPRKIAPAQAAMQYFVGSKPGFVHELQNVGEDAAGFIFRAPTHLRPEGAEEALVTLVWLTYDEAVVDRLAGARYFDVCGREIETERIKLWEAPVYVLTTDTAPAAINQAISSMLDEAGLL